KGINIYPIAYSDLIAKTAAQIGEHQISKVSRIINVLAVSASLALLGLDLKYLNLSVERTFASKKKIVDMNEVGAKLAYEAARGLLNQPLPSQLSPIQTMHYNLIHGIEDV